jgi:tRNA-Thr(GGU) m(6)t(6)A37 methyltransferase TsaA
MAAELPEIKLKAIGTVRSEIKERAKGHTVTADATIEIDPALAPGLDNLDEFSHIIIIYYIHKTQRPAPLKVFPRHHAHPHEVGVFASRSPDRPNPIAKSTVRLLKRAGNILTVAKLDSVENAAAPSWTKY